MPEGNELSREELAQKVSNLKQRDKLKVFKIIMDAFVNHENLEDTIHQTLVWCDKLCDYKNSK